MSNSAACFTGMAPTAWTSSEKGGLEGGVLKATLENGLKGVILRNTLAPVVTTMVNDLVGSNEAPEGFPGMAHAQEHMMFRGSPGLSANQLAQINAVMRGMFNADANRGSPHISFRSRQNAWMRSGTSHYFN